MSILSSTTFPLTFVILFPTTPTQGLFALLAVDGKLLLRVRRAIVSSRRRRSRLPTKLLFQLLQPGHLSGNDETRIRRHAYPLASYDSLLLTTLLTYSWAPLNSIVLLATTLTYSLGSTLALQCLHLYKAPQRQVQQKCL